MINSPINMLVFGATIAGLIIGLVRFAFVIEKLREENQELRTELAATELALEDERTKFD